MKRFTFIITFLMTLNMFAAYNIGDTVLPADDLTWTDNLGYSSTIFNEIDSLSKVVVIFWGGEG
ncbi:MAG: hypothetical protein GQ534_00155 [Candidatus Delongbacteria bacterium]|nr:hypothetical protein [Candidatus Delongbacteria bacterium]